MNQIYIMLIRKPPHLREPLPCDNSPAFPSIFSCAENLNKPTHSISRMFYEFCPKEDCLRVEIMREKKEVVLACLALVILETSRSYQIENGKGKRSKTVLKTPSPTG